MFLFLFFFLRFLVITLFPGPFSVFGSYICIFNFILLSFRHVVFDFFKTSFSLSGYFSSKKFVSFVVYFIFNTFFSCALPHFPLLFISLVFYTSVSLPTFPVLPSPYPSN